MPKPLPPIVKQYKHITVPGIIAAMQNTGIYLHEGDFYSILATGAIDYYKRFIKRPEDGTALMARIGRKNRFFFPLSVGHNVSTRRSYDSGNLYVGFKLGPVNRYGEPSNSESYSLTEGSFGVDIIVWKREDYVGIAGFFEEMSQRDPKNKLITDALNEANRRKEIYIARAKASKEIQETKKEIKKLKEAPDLYLASRKESKERQEATKETQELEGKLLTEKEHVIKIAPGEKVAPQAEPPPVESVKDEKVARLEARLSELTETLNRLEEMKEQLEEVKKETSLLTKELSQQESREKDLLTRLEQAEKIPPVIVVVAPRDDIEVEVGTISFSGVIQDDRGVQGVDIFINKNPLLAKVSGDIKLSGKKLPRRLEFAERIALQRGKNEIRIRATDTDGLSAEKVLTVRYREIRKNVWAVVIGIDRYQKIRHLKYAVKDAGAFYHHLIHNNRIPQENVTLMVNEEARLTRMRSILGTHLKNKPGKGDMVIIYFAGHGACEKDVMSPDKDGLEKYILPYDADPKDLYASALPMREISHIFNRIRSERLIFIADACYSGASGGRTISLAGIRANISEAFLDRIAGGKGRIILTASGANEVSGEDDELKHGVFTYFLLEGLRGKADMDKDGMITVDEAYRYVSREVPRATGQEQHPVKKGFVEGQLVLGIIE